ncbi:Imm31 family immunity protein [Isosphaeraceae bacterium EP7]
MDRTATKDDLAPTRWRLISLRLFAETDDPRVANDIAAMIESKAGKLGGVQTQPVERYWKIPEYYEVSIDLRPDDETIVAVECMLAELATGWDRHGSGSDLWAIWTPSEEGLCFAPLVRWMSLDVSWMGSDARFDFDEKVVVVGSRREFSKVRGELGVVVGRACGEDGCWSYALRIYRIGICWHCEEDDLQPNGDPTGTPGV